MIVCVCCCCNCFLETIPNNHDNWCFNFVLPKIRDSDKTKVHGGRSWQCPYGGEGYSLQSAGTCCPRGETNAFASSAISGFASFKVVSLQVAIRKRKCPSLMALIKARRVFLTSGYWCFDNVAIKRNFGEVEFSLLSWHFRTLE